MNDESARYRRFARDVTTTTASVAPRLVIVLGLEERPKVHEEAEHEGDSRRLEDWIKSRPALLKLVVDALELGRKKAA